MAAVYTTQYPVLQPKKNPPQDTEPRRSFLPSSDYNVGGGLDYMFVPPPAVESSPYDLRIATPGSSSRNVHLEMYNSAQDLSKCTNTQDQIGEVSVGFNRPLTQKRAYADYMAERYRNEENPIYRPGGWQGWAGPADWDPVTGEYNRVSFAQGQVLSLRTPYGHNYDRYIDPGDSRRNIHQAGFGGFANRTWGGQNNPVAPQYSRQKDLAYDVGPIIGNCNRPAAFVPSLYQESANQQFTKRTDLYS